MDECRTKIAKRFFEILNMSNGLHKLSLIEKEVLEQMKLTLIEEEITQVLIFLTLSLRCFNCEPWRNDKVTLVTWRLFTLKQPLSCDSRDKAVCTGLLSFIFLIANWFVCWKNYCVSSPSSLFFFYGCRLVDF